MASSSAENEDVVLPQKYTLNIDPRSNHLIIHQ